MRHRTIERVPLHTQARAILVRAIVRGDLPAGHRVNETRLSESIGVSRTPLRQALAGLERDGFVETRPGKGFFVTDVSETEARELYDLLAMLEPMAVSMPGYRLDAAELHRVNDRLGAATDLDETVELNLAWHAALTRGCPNAKLRNMIATLRSQARRYEYFFFEPGLSSVRASVDLHADIADALEGGDRDRAASLLAQHWRTDLDRIAAPHDPPSPDPR